MYTYSQSNNYFISYYCAEYLRYKNNNLIFLEHFVVMNLYAYKMQMYISVVFSP